MTVYEVEQGKIRLNATLDALFNVCTYNLKGRLALNYCRIKCSHLWQVTSIAC